MTKVEDYVPWSVAPPSDWREAECVQHERPEELSWEEKEAMPGDDVI